MALTQRDKLVFGMALGFATVLVESGADAEGITVVSQSYDIETIAGETDAELDAIRDEFMAESTVVRAAITAAALQPLKVLASLIQD